MSVGIIKIINSNKMADFWAFGPLARILYIYCSETRYEKLIKEISIYPKQISFLFNLSKTTVFDSVYVKRY